MPPEIAALLPLTEFEMVEVLAYILAVRRGRGPDKTPGDTR